jgi:MFS transporter, DHA2 family, multidrug resistance protein
MGGLRRTLWSRSSPRRKPAASLPLVPAAAPDSMNSTEDGLAIPQRYWAITTLMIGVALSCLDTALVNVALPTIARDLSASPANSIWVVNAYQLAVMISLLPFASLGDIFGYRRVYALAWCCTPAPLW